MNLARVHLKPDCLAGEGKSLVAKICPAGAPRQLIHFGEGKSAGGGQARVVLRHRFAKHGCSQKMNAECRKRATTQIGYEDEFSRKFATAFEHADRVFIAEVMKRECAKDEIVWLVRFPF